MTNRSTSQFESIEEAHEYVRLLGEVVGETREIISDEIAEASLEITGRRTDALRLVDFKLDQLRRHLTASSRLLNDLRILRRALYGERETQALLPR